MTPTPYAALNRLLGELVDGVTSVFGEGVVGAYLHGSFALGDADGESDVDFVVAIRDGPTTEQVTALQSIHDRLSRTESPWAMRLEGSYVPESALRAAAVRPRRFLFLGNGETELRWDSHCDTAVMRRTTREQGVVLFGPPPATLIDPVDSAALRAEAFPTLLSYVAWANELARAGTMSEWDQTYLILTYARILCVIARGEVVSKRAAAMWAAIALEERWRGLVTAACESRYAGLSQPHRAALPELVAATLAFTAELPLLAERAMPVNLVGSRA